MRGEVASIQPVVLVGGRSHRFGRDKLRERLASPEGREEWLIDRPIAALRVVFGKCVALVGDCSAEIAARADLHWPDDHPGAGPAGGVLTALERSGADVFVLAGDLPNVAPTSVRRILEKADASPDAWAILARTSGVEACIGLYRRSMAGVFAERIHRPAGAAPLLSLHDAAPTERLVLVEIEACEALNINTVADLRPTVPPGLAVAARVAGGKSIV